MITCLPTFTDDSKIDLWKIIVLSPIIPFFEIAAEMLLIDANLLCIIFDNTLQISFSSIEMIIFSLDK